MAIVPEKNYIDIKKLFNWGKQFKVFDIKGSVLLEYYQRLPTDEEVNKARVFALRKSAELRKKLRTQDSDERLAFLAEKEVLSLEQLVETIIYYKTKQLISQTYSDIDFPFPKEPHSDSSLEEQEKYQEEVDTYSDRREKYIKSEVEKSIIKERENLLSKSMDELYPYYEDLVIEEICQKEMVGKFRDFCIFSGSFVDEEYQNQIFSSLDDIYSLPEFIKDQLLTNYLSLDIDLEELKK